MDFKTIKAGLEKHFAEMTQDGSILYETDTDPMLLWEKYLNAIPENENKVFRQRRSYDCSCCRHFIKNIGGLVSIKNHTVETVWDFVTDDPEWNKVIKTLADYVRQHSVTGRYLSSFRYIGTDSNMDNVLDIRWCHFAVKLPNQLVFNGHGTIDTARGQFRDEKNVFKRGLDELKKDAVETVLELVNQGSLYKGDEYKHLIVSFLNHKRRYERLPEPEKDLYAWENAKDDPAVAKIRNTAIGTLLVNVSEGMELDQAVSQYEKIVAPENYKRSKPIFTKRMLEEAQKTITELGYLDSLERRFATADDITVNNILYLSKDTAKRVTGGSIFDDMQKDVKSAPKKFSKVEEVPVQDFIDKVLPTAREVEAYFENKHIPNLVSLIAPVHPEGKTLFKWGNSFGWSYRGNVADSKLKENVKKAGGKVDGALRFSIQWNDLDGWDQNDEDAHCMTPEGFHIYYVNKRDPLTGGNLDVDIIHPVKGKPAVENITFPSMDRMDTGTYQFLVNCYSNRGGTSGFRAEIEFDGQIYTFDYDKPLRQSESVKVADVTLQHGQFSIKTHIPCGTSSREEWGIKTNEFVPVKVICFSPNYWDERNGIGHKHYMFMLKGCVNPEMPPAWYNEYLNGDLYPQHRKVMEAMATIAHVQDTEDQLSGLGFSSTVRNDLVVKVKGSTERIIKIKF